MFLSPTSGSSYIYCRRPEYQYKFWAIGQNSANALTIYNEANIGLYIVSNQTAWSANSDATLKKDIESLHPSLDKILSLRPVTFHWKREDSAVDTTHLGLIAQEVQEVIPELVDTDNDGLKSVRYTDLIPFMVNAIQELHALVMVQK